MTEKLSILATDLDGTFLGGSAEDRQTLYQLVSGSQDIQLVFVTGRGLEAVMPLLSDPLVPTPDYIICDVGSTVVEGASLQPVQPLQANIDRRWPGELAVAAAVAAFPELERQEVPQQRRCSYFCHQDAVTPALVEAARAGLRGHVFGQPLSRPAAGWREQGQHVAGAGRSTRHRS